MLSQICDGLDYRQLEKAYTRKGYELAASPRRMFKIAAFGYMNGNYSSRGIEEACRRDIHYMWLLEGHKAPDHNTIARFRRDRLVPVMEDLFTQLVKALYERGEIAFGDLFVDGTKIEANANRYSFVWRKAVEKQAEKLAPKLTEQARQLQAEYGLLGETPEGTLFALEEKAKAEGIRFVSGKGSRKTRLQKDIESLGGLLEKERKYTEYGAVFEGRNSFSKTDTDATFMHMKEDHMQNGQLKPGYNLVLGVEGEYITGALLSSDRSDVNTLIPLLERMNTNYGRRNKSVTADAGFESEENCAYLEENGQMCFIKPANYEQRRKRLKTPILEKTCPTIQSRTHIPARQVTGFCGKACENANIQADTRLSYWSTNVKAARAVPKRLSARRRRATGAWNSPQNSQPSGNARCEISKALAGSFCE